MPINASPHFEKAQAEHESAVGTEAKIRTLKKMITLAPKHKGAENLLKQLKTRLKKLKYSQEKESKKSSSSQKGIKKHDMQAAIIGFTNSGKSSLLSALTNAQPIISENKFTTIEPIIGMMNYAGTQIQLIEIPAVDSINYNKGLVNTADTILILINKIEEIKEILEKTKDSQGKKIIIFNNKNNLNERKISETLKSKKYNFIILSKLEDEVIGQRQIKKINDDFSMAELKEKIFTSFNKIRIYTKEPGKIKSPKPVIMNPDSTVYDIAEKILHGFSNKVKETKIWGPSSKFPGQKIGLKHKLKDLDVVEFKTK